MNDKYLDMSVRYQQTVQNYLDKVGVLKSNGKESDY